MKDGEEYGRWKNYEKENREVADAQQVGNDGRGRGVLGDRVEIAGVNGSADHDGVEGYQRREVSAD